jgi:hypothetical protein
LNGRQLLGEPAHAFELFFQLFIDHHGLLPARKPTVCQSGKPQLR